MRRVLFGFCLLFAAAAAAQPPAPSGPPTDRWHLKAREIYARAIAFQTVQGAQPEPGDGRLTCRSEFRAGGLQPTSPCIRYDDTASLILRWPAGAAVGPQGDPADGAYGRGRGAAGRTGRASRSSSARRAAISTAAARSDDKAGRGRDHHRVAAAAAPRASGPTATSSSCSPATRRPAGEGAEHAANRMARSRRRSNIALNADAGGGAYARRTARRLGFGIQTAEKIYQDLHLHRDQSRRAQLPAAPRQRHLRARPTRWSGSSAIASSRG